MTSWLANKFSNSISDGWIGHPCKTITKLLYSSRNPWIMILFIQASPMVDFESSLVISRQIDLTLWKYWAIVMSREIDNNSFSRSCSLVSFYSENNIMNVSHASFAVLSSQMCSNISSSVMVFKANIILPALILYLCKASLESSSDDVVSFPQQPPKGHVLVIRTSCMLSMRCSSSCWVSWFFQRLGNRPSCWLYLSNTKQTLFDTKLA